VAVSLPAIVATALVAAAAWARPPMPPDPSLTGPPLKFRIDLSPEEESHVVKSPARGVGELTLDRATMTLSWRITFEKMTSAATGAHVHGPQTPGGNAGVLFPLAPGAVTSPIEGSAILNEGWLEYILTGRAYVNIHTRNYPDGELRAPIMRVRTDAPTQ
jgi:hypothetical protein